MRNKVLQNSQTIDIGGVGFTISGIAGNGSSCVVYWALRANDKSKWLIKEFYPDGYEFTRDTKTNQINYSNDVKSELDRFLKTVEIMTKIYNDVDRNDTSPEDSCSCNCTGYVVIPQLEGKTLKEYDPEGSLKALFTQVQLVSKKLKKYHGKKYLYLDIKPENIFCCDGDSSRVQIIDFDSVIEEDAHDDNVTIRCSSDWAAPELITGKRDKISAATDVYAVGEMLYYKLTGEHSDIMERTMHGNHDLSKSELLKGANPALLNKLAEFFRRTLCSAPSARYSDDELIEALNNMIKISDAPYIKTNLEKPPFPFVGRDDKLFDDVHNHLKNDHYLFIQGMGGIGKTAFAVKYANTEKYSKEYDVICHTEESLDPIKEIQLGNYPDSSEDHRKKWAAICKACSYVHKKRVLMIFDNAEEIKEETIKQLLNKELDCDKLFLTRNANISDMGRSHVTLDKLSEEDAVSLFKYNWKNNEDAVFNDTETEDIKKIVNFFERHTLFVQLAARAVKACGNIKKFIEDVEQGKTRALKVKVRGGKSNEKLTPNEHLKILFDIHKLSEDELKAFSCLSLFPRQGVQKSLIDNIDINVINDLVDKGWVQDKFIADKEVISLHPLMEELAEEELYKDPSLCRDFLSGLIQLANDKCEACGNDIRYIISTVSKRLLNGRTAISEKRNAQRKSFIKLSEAADVLILSCGFCGNASVRAECLKAAMLIYLSSGDEVNVKKALNLAEKLIYEYINEISANADDVAKCLDLMLEVLPKNKRNRQILLRWFCAAFKALGKSGDEIRLNERVEKLNQYLLNTYGKYGFIMSCLVCGDGLREDRIDLAEKFYKLGVQRYDELDELNPHQKDSNKREIFENDLYDLRDWFITSYPFSKFEEPLQDEQPRLHDIFRSRLLQVKLDKIIFSTKAIPIYEPPYVKLFEGKSVKEQIVTSLSEPNSTERAGMLAHAALNACRKDTDSVLTCVQEMKETLDSDISTAPELLDNISNIIGLANNCNDDYATIEELINKLIKENDLVPKWHEMIIKGYT